MSIRNVFCFVVEFDAMRKGWLENVIPGSTFTNISTKNMQGSKNYDNIWISRHAKLHHFTGQAGMSPCVSAFSFRKAFVIYLMKSQAVQARVTRECEIINYSLSSDMSLSIL